MITLERTNEYSTVQHENEMDMKYNAPHHFYITTINEPYKNYKIDFQEGSIKEVGINGVFNEDLLIMIITRLEYFQNSKFACEENKRALEHIKEALKYLNLRTIDRTCRGVEGTNEV